VSGPAALPRQYVKYCDAADWDDPRLLETVQAILPERDAATHVERKVWEFATLAMFLEDTGRLHEGTEALAVGAGDERIVFWLANRLGRVVATDIYGSGDFADGSAAAAMLRDPASCSPFPYREDHLEVRWMDGRRLDFPDASFDVVFSLSSIEHFGRQSDVAGAAAEMGRVLRPGGHAYIVTDAYVRLHPLDARPDLGRGRRAWEPGSASRWRRRPWADAFTARELHRGIVAPSGLELMQPLDTTVGPRAWENVAAITGQGDAVTETGERWPHVLLRYGRSHFTSVGLALRKPG